MTDTDNMIAGLRAWLKKYDELADTRIDVDHLRGGIGSFSILADSMPETLATFMFGRQRRRTFYLSRECAYGDDSEQNIDNLAWYEDFSRWVYRQDMLREYPDLGDGMTCFSVADSTAGSIVAITESGKAEYRIGISIDYAERMI